LTQVATFGAYAIVALVSGAPTFSAAQAITALSILNILMMPLSILLVNILFAFSAFGCFKRIQEFLLLEEKIETRNVHCPTRSSLQSATGRQEAVELQDLQRPSGHSSPVSIVDGDFHWDDANVLNDINLSLGSATKGSLTMVIGPIGSGKSTLLKAILGETPSKRGLVTLMSPDVAYCDQSPWIMNSTVQGNIIAESEGFDETWYDTVIEACDLSTDFARLPSGSSTVVGEDGLKLSGGQKQRIVRGFYSQPQVEQVLTR
jgi:ABC-type multidrug transport system fused ATPase/permease subunit